MQTGAVPVPRAKNDPPRDDVAVKVDRKVIKKAKAVAGMREIHLAKYLSDLLGPLVERDWQAMYAEGEGKRKGGK